jgi:hypothetical protein
MKIIDLLETDDDLHKAMRVKAKELMLLFQDELAKHDIDVIKTEPFSLKIGLAWGESYKLTFKLGDQEYKARIDATYSPGQQKEGVRVEVTSERSGKEVVVASSRKFPDPSGEEAVRTAVTKLITYHEAD